MNQVISVVLVIPTVLALAAAGFTSKQVGLIMLAMGLTCISYAWWNRV